MGAVVSVFITHFIPRQRQDRFQQFAEQLNEKFEILLAEMGDRLQASPAFAVLAEEVCLSAVRTPSNDRRRDLAALLKDGFDRDDAELQDSLTLLRILDELNDRQIMLLACYGEFEHSSFGDLRCEEIHKRHTGFFPFPPNHNDEPEVLEPWAKNEHYINELVNRQLLKDHEGMARSSGSRRVAIAPLGRKLLKGINRLEK